MTSNVKSDILILLKEERYKDMKAKFIKKYYGSKRSYDEEMVYLEYEYRGHLNPLKDTASGLISTKNQTTITKHKND